MSGRTRTRTGIEVKNPLTVKAVGYIDVETEKDENNNIVSITFPGMPKINIGQKIHIGRKKQPYKINLIKVVGPSNNKTYEMSIAKRTKASLFILPMLSGTRATYFFDKKLVNCFVGTEMHSNTIVLLYRFSGDLKFVQFEDSLKNMEIFKTSEDPSTKTVLYIFNVPGEHLEDFCHFINGKYSKFSESYKKRILKFHNVGKESTIGKILYRSKSRKKQLEEVLDLNIKIDKDAELYSIPKLEEEIYDPKIYDI